MKKYECQMIEGCNVHSYAVTLPLAYLHKLDAKKKAAAKRAKRKKAFLRLLLLVLMPMALVLDLAMAVVRAVIRPVAKLLSGDGVVGTSASSLVQSAGFFLM